MIIAQTDKKDTCITHVQNINLELIPELLHFPVPMPADQ